MTEITQAVRQFFLDSHQEALWWKTPNPRFGGVSPDEMLKLGRFKQVLQLVREARRANDAASQGGRSAS